MNTPTTRADVVLLAALEKRSGLQLAWALSRWAAQADTIYLEQLLAALSRQGRREIVWKRGRGEKGLLAVAVGPNWQESGLPDPIRAELVQGLMSRRLIVRPVHVKGARGRPRQGTFGAGVRDGLSVAAIEAQLIKDRPGRLKRTAIAEEWAPSGEVKTAKQVEAAARRERRGKAALANLVELFEARRRDAK